MSPVLPILLSLCASYGREPPDGGLGLKPVHEICGFPEGSERGAVVCPSSRPGAGQCLTGAYRGDQPGSVRSADPRKARPGTRGD